MTDQQHLAFYLKHHHACRKDDQWHHIAVTWHQGTGSTSMYFDGRPQSAFWVSRGSTLDQPCWWHECCASTRLTPQVIKLLASSICPLCMQVSEAGVVDIRPPDRTVETRMAAGTTRAPSGTHASHCV